MNNKSIFIILSIIIALCLTTSNGMVIKEKITSSKDFVFLGKFCFSTVHPSSLNYTGVSSNPNTMIYVYDDLESEWGIGGNSNNNCSVRVHSAARWFSANNTHHLAPNDVKREHFWYVAAANCVNGSVDTLDFTLTFLNGGGLWSAQFSYDEQGLEALYLVYFFIFLILVVYTGYTAFRLFKTNSLHLVIKILSIAVVLEFLSVFVLLCNYGSYSHNGTGGKGAQGFGELLDFASQLLLILLLILIAKGYAISKASLHDKKIVFGAMGILAALYFILFVWIKAGEDPTKTTYMYDTVPGILLLIARSLAFLYFAWCGYNTYMEETHPAKRNFYTVFSIAFIAWFLVLPIISIIAASVEPWVREKIVLSFYVTTNAIALFGVSFLLSPTRSGEFLATATKTSSEEYSSISTKYDDTF